MKEALSDITHTFVRILKGKERPQKITWAEFKQGWIEMSREEQCMWVGLFVALILLLLVVLGTVF